MALINCPRCYERISNEVYACPYCGFRMKTDDISEAIASFEEEEKPVRQTVTVETVEETGSWTVGDTFLLLLLILLQVLAVFFLYLCLFKWPYESAKEYYQAERAAYEQQVAEYQGYADRIAEENAKLETEISRLQNLVYSEDKPKSKQTTENAITSINGARAAMAEVPAVGTEAIATYTQDSVFRSKEILEAGKAIDRQRFALYNAFSGVEIPDYTVEIQALKSAASALEESIRQKKEESRITPELKSFLDGYEAAVNEFCALAGAYDPLDPAAVQRLAELENRLAELAGELENYDPEQMKSADRTYYLTVVNRCTPRLAEAAAALQ